MFVKGIGAKGSDWYNVNNMINQRGSLVQAESSIAAGARVAIRDAEWLVRRVERTSHASTAVYCVGLSELVRDKESIFLSDLDKIEVLRPEETALVADTSRSYSHSLIYLESLLRQSPPTDDGIYIGHKGAMDVVPFQLDPAIQALKEPRQRILIADAVGLGKTIECGILLSELIRRGRGKRILVLAVKSMLTQFQKELWARFTIPLVRLDSVGIQRIRRDIPSNHNPFYYYDKAIISIDTLKQESEYRTYIENAYWDIIVIDEAHNVAERGKSSMRAKLAKLVSSRSDTLIMLSATPHDGKKRSFASIMNMLNPTAIANPDDYGPEDIKGLFIRRFKKDIKDQVKMSFKERTVSRAYCQASPAEEAVHAYFSDLEFSRIDKRKTGNMLFKTTLEKALFSSPAACIDTIRNRMHKLRKEDETGNAQDIKVLAALHEQLKALTPADMSKYQELIRQIKQSGWKGQDTEDRLVIFTERIETLRFLEEHLPGDLGLNPKKVVSLFGSLSDVEQQEVVERFGREGDSVRLLLASDVASEGINLHYLSHRLIHYDIPWSLMVFQQRNGRIDRYGQEKEPSITYLITRSETLGIKGDLRILELLTEKDEQVMTNIGDPSEFTGIYDAEVEAAKTAKAMEAGLDVQAFEAKLEKHDVDPLAILMGDLDAPAGEDAESATRTMPSLFSSDYAYVKEGLNFVRQRQPLQFDAVDTEEAITLSVPAELEHRLKYLPPEIDFHDGQIFFTANRDQVQKEIARCRKEEREWPRIHLLWDQHPVVEWVNDKATTAYRRHEAPVLSLQDALKADESIFIVSGVIPNRKGHPIIHSWFGIRFRGDTFDESLDFDDVVRITELGQRQFANPGSELDTKALSSLLPAVVKHARARMTTCRNEHDQTVRPKLDAQLSRLNRLRGRRVDQLELQFTSGSDRMERERRQVDKLFDNYKEWIQDTMTTEDKPYIRIAAVVRGGS